MSNVFYRRANGVSIPELKVDLMIGNGAKRKQARLTLELIMSKSSSINGTVEREFILVPIELVTEDGEVVLLRGITLDRILERGLSTIYEERREAYYSESLEIILNELNHSDDEIRDCFMKVANAIVDKIEQRKSSDSEGLTNSQAK